MRRITVVILPQELITCPAEALRHGGQIHLTFHVVDGGDAYVSTSLNFNRRGGREVVRGVLRMEAEGAKARMPGSGNGEDVFVVLRPGGPKENAPSGLAEGGQLQAWVKREGGFEPREVRVIQFGEELFARIQGLYETEVLQRKSVLVVGVGSGGSTIALELAKAGVGSFFLVDHDRVEIVNLIRHAAGLSDLGRFKTKAVKDLILEKNPFANVETHERECDWGWVPMLQELVRRADLTFCCTDNRYSRTLVNYAALNESRVCIYGGAFRRGYGGHVLRVVPRQTICYQCFIDSLSDEAEDIEVSGVEQAAALQYADRPVAVEPGLCSDIAPISNMCVKLGILELLRGTPTTLASLYEDLPDPWYQWLNRREGAAGFAELQPMGKGGELGILSWHGVACERNQDCPACGDYLASASGSGGGQPTPDEIESFNSASR